MTDTTFYKLYSNPTPTDTTTLFSNYNISDISKKHIDVKTEKSIFSAHELHKENTSYLKRAHRNFDYAFPILIADIVFILLLFNLYRKQSMHLALFSNKYYQQILSKSVLSYPISWAFLFVYIFNISLFIDISLQKNNFHIEMLNIDYTLPSIILIITLYYAFKSILIFLIATIFKVGSYRRIYIDYIFLWTMSMGIFLSAYLWFELYTDISWLYLVFIGIWIAFGALRILTPIFNIMPKSDFNSFHFFIYLCSVEILPLIVLGKIVMLAIS